MATTLVNLPNSIITYDCFFKITSTDLGKTTNLMKNMAKLRIDYEKNEVFRNYFHFLLEIYFEKITRNNFRLVIKHRYQFMSYRKKKYYLSA